MQKNLINPFFLLPRPLLDPTLWPEAGETANSQNSPGCTWLFPLDVATAAGGVYRRRILEAAEAKRIGWLIPARFFGGDRPVQAAIRRDEAREWIEKTHASILMSDHPHLVEELTDRMIIRSDVVIPDSRAWAEEIFPNLRRAAGDVWLRRELSAFEKELGCKIEFAWEDLGFFAGFLRQARETEHAVLAAREWAHFRALYSPQDEASEKARLGVDRLALNPTAQTLRLKDQLKIVYRRDEGVEDVVIGWREALIIDEISELARQSSTELLQKVMHESAGAENTFDDPKNHPQGAPDFQKALTFLIDRGIVLQGS